jgi:TonB family protein
MTLIALALAIGVRAQVGNSETKHFEKAGLVFDFPGDWTLTDKSSDEVPYFAVASAGNTTQVSVIDQIAAVSPCDQTAGKLETDALLERIATQIHAARPLQTAPVKLQIGTVEIPGVQLRGSLNNQPITGEIYSLQLNPQFVNLVYLRLDNDQRGQAAWETIRATMKLAPTVVGTQKLDLVGVPTGVRAPIRGGVLNGKAIHLAQPPYPAQARAEHASGTVVVKVIIDEHGNVISANAVSGNFLLQPASIAAARESKFSPTKLCGQPVRVIGIIQYNFVAR